MGAARAEPNGTVRRAYASATASVVRYAPDARVGKLVAEAVEIYTEVHSSTSAAGAESLIQNLHPYPMLTTKPILTLTLILVPN